MLTDLAIKNLKPKERLYRKADSGGLCIEVTPKGKKLWRLRYNHQGKAQMHSLGAYPQISLTEARKLRDEAKELVQSGKQLTREKNKQKQQAAFDDGNSFASVAERWMELKGSGLNAKYFQQMQDRLKQHVYPKIGNLPIKEITIPDIVEVVEDIAKNGIIETAKRMKQVISQIFRYAAQRGLCEHNPAADLRDILPSVEQQHHACITIAELPELLHKMDDMAQGLTKYAMQLVLLTFVRTNELIGAKWEEIDWNKAEWNIPKERMKMRKPHMVPLSEQALKLLKELHQQTGHTDFIFYSAASKSKHISNGSILMGLRRLGYRNKMTGHGFRSLASTALNEQGYDPDVIEVQLAHADKDQIRAAYNRASYILKRKQLMQSYADWIDVVKTKKNGTEDVISLNARKHN